jgi:iron complex outermembrane receptor protein
MTTKFLSSSTIALALCLSSAIAKVEKTEADSVKSYETPSVTVTSTKAFERSTPLPFNEMKKEELLSRYITSDMPKLLSTMPSVMYLSQNGNGIGYSNLTMRGFDQRRIAVMVNGIPQNDPEDHQVYWIDMPDLTSSVESIQVQRGAGLSNYGSPSIGGSINLSTSNYANQSGIKLFSGVGIQEYNYNDKIFHANTSKFGVEYSSGLVDKYSVYFKLSSIKSNGYRDNSWTNMQSYFLSVCRFDENLSTQINFFGGPVSDGLVYNGLPKAYITDSKLRKKNYAASGWAYDSTGKNLAYASDRRKQEIENFSQPHFEILNDWNISPNIELKSSLFYYQGDGFFDGESSWADDYFNNIAANDYKIDDNNKLKGVFLRAWVSNKQGGWIPRLIFKSENNQLTVGGEIRIHRSNHYGKTLFAAQLPKDFDIDYKFYSNSGKRDIFSVFVKDNYAINDKVTVFADLQLVTHSFRIGDEMLGNNYTTYLDKNGKTIGNGDNLFNVNFTFLNPRIGVNYNPNKEINLYAFAAYTSREPRMRNLYASDDAYTGAKPKFKTVDLGNGKTGIDFDSPLAKPEKMLDIELGANYEANGLKLGANAYLMDYNDELVKTGKVDVWGNPIDENASKSRHYGIELQAQYALINKAQTNLTFWANATYSKNYFIDYSVFLKTKANGRQEVKLDDNEIAGFPDFMTNFGVNFKYSGFFAGITGKWVNDFYTDNYGKMLQTNQTIITSLTESWDGYYADNVVDSYLVFDLDLSYKFEHTLFCKTITLKAQINNMFNKLYAGGGEGKEFFPGAERNVFLGFELGL